MVGRGSLFYSAAVRRNLFGGFLCDLIVDSFDLAERWIFRYDLGESGINEKDSRRSCRCYFLGAFPLSKFRRVKDGDLAASAILSRASSLGA